MDRAAPAPPEPFDSDFPFAVSRYQADTALRCGSNGEHVSIHAGEMLALTDNQPSPSSAFPPGTVSDNNAIVETTELPDGHRMLKLSMPEYIADLVS